MGQDEEEIFSRKTTEGVIGSATTSWIWFNRTNQILEGTAKVDGTPNGFDQGYAHVGPSQAPTIEDDDTSPSQARSAPPQSPPSTILAFDTFCQYIQYGHSR
jgi:hypothetical protein